MPERREDAAIRTDRPSPADLPSADGGLPTVREILTLPPVAAGVPEVLSSDAALDARVRWVHVSDSAGVARLLNGGELLLSTGSGWPTDPAELADFIAGLVEAGLSGLVLELGVHYRYVPAIVESAARERGLALVALHHEVKFVTLTEAVHSRIISEQTAALRARDEVRERFTALSLRGAPADYIVRQLADTLGAAVVLENLAHEVVAAEGSFGADGEVLAEWEARSRRAHRLAAEPPGAGAAAPTRGLAHRARRGAGNPLGPPHRADRPRASRRPHRGARTGRHRARPRATRRRRCRRVGACRPATTHRRACSLAGSRVSPRHPPGSPRPGCRSMVRVLRGLVATGAPVTGTAADVAARTLGGRAIAGDAPGVRSSARATVVLLSLPAGAPSAIARPGLRAARSPEMRHPPTGWCSRSVRPPATSTGCSARCRKRSTWRGRPAARVAHGPTLRRGEDRPLMRLVTSLRDDHRLLRHSERMLAPLIEYDLARGGDLLDVLGAMLAHPANRTAAASASHLSRSVFYQRLALIGDLLGVDLDDGETLTALHLALLVRRSSGR